MLTPRLVVTLTEPETGRPWPTELDALPVPVTAVEAGLMAGEPVPVIPLPLQVQQEAQAKSPASS